GSHAAGEARRFVGKTFRRCKLAGVRENLHPRWRNVAGGIADIDKQSAGEHGTFCALPAFVAAKLASSQRSGRRMESRQVRSSPENPKRDVGKVSGSRFFSVARAGHCCRPSGCRITEQK